MAKARDGVLTGELRGSVAGLSYVPSRLGTQVRSRPVRRARRSAAQGAQEARVQRIAAFWAGIGPEGAGLWRAYAEGLVAAMPALERRPMSPYNAFLMLTTRLLQLDPRRATVPMTPPTLAFLGDAVGVAGSGTGGPEGNPTPAPPRGEGSPSGALFAANRANAQGVVTELLVQPLKSGARAPQAGRYASQGFAAFEGPGDAAFVPLSPGWKALAVRFVEEATGQASALVPLGIVWVG